MFIDYSTPEAVWLPLQKAFIASLWRLSPSELSAVYFTTNSGAVKQSIRKLDEAPQDVLRDSLFADSGRWAFLAVTHPNTLEDDLVRYASLKEADPLFVKMALANLARRSLASGALAS